MIAIIRHGIISSRTRIENLKIPRPNFQQRRQPKNESVNLYFSRRRWPYRPSFLKRSLYYPQKHVYFPCIMPFQLLNRLLLLLQVEDFDVMGWNGGKALWPITACGYDTFIYQQNSNEFYLLRLCP